MFAGSFSTSEELAEKLAGHNLSLMDDDTFNAYMSQEFPECYGHYKKTREIHGTTWTITRPALISLLSITQERPGILDYVIAESEPESNETIGADRLNKGLRSLPGKSITDIMSWQNRGGLEKITRAYKR